jgi:hypothetical protein
MNVSSITASPLGHFAIFPVSLALVVVGLWLWSHHQAQSELLALPMERRHTLYKHTRETLETICMNARGPNLSEYCYEQALFIAQLPECDANCQDICQRFAPQPTK